MKEETVVADTSVDTEEELNLDLEPESEPNTEEDWEARAKKAEELAKNQKIRAEKAEKLAKGVKETPKTPTSDTLSDRDMFALLKANVHEDDVDRVKKYAKFEGITVAEALKSDELEAILKLKAEQRNVADATNVSSQRRGTAKLTDDALIRNAQAGKMPESDDDISRLMRAKLYEGKEKK